MYRYHAWIQYIRLTYRIPNDNVQPTQLLMRAPDELLALRDDAAVLLDVNPRTHSRLGPDIQTHGLEHDDLDAGVRGPDLFGKLVGGLRVARVVDGHVGAGGGEFGRDNGAEASATISWSIEVQNWGGDGTESPP